MISYKLFNNAPSKEYNGLLEEQKKDFERILTHEMPCPNSAKPPTTIIFNLNIQTISISEKGIFEMAFVDEGFHLESIDITRREIFDELAKKRYPSLLCKDASVVINYPMKNPAGQGSLQKIFL